MTVIPYGIGERKGKSRKAAHPAWPLMSDGSEAPRSRQTGIFVNQSQLASKMQDNRFIPSPSASGENFGGWPTQRVENPEVVARRERMQRAATLKPR